MNEKEMNVPKGASVLIGELLEVFLEFDAISSLRTTTAKELYKTRLLSHILDKLSEQEWEQWEQWARDEGVELDNEAIYNQFTELEQDFLREIFSACEVTPEFLRKILEDGEVTPEIYFTILDKIIFAYLYGTQANGDEVCNV
jgi:DNA-binding GntR family transcriptional regulator